VQQTVILAAGLDARAWRLDWPAGTVVYELDQPQVLQFKQTALDGKHPKAGYVGVPIDLRENWPQALQKRGFNPGSPTAWLAEGLLPYLPSAAQDLLFERIQSLSAPGSRLAVEAFGPDFFTPENLARRRERRQKLIAAAAELGREVPNVEELWYNEDRTDVALWLGTHNWDAQSTGARALMLEFGRVPDEETFPVESVFVAATLRR
jgi:methyltransferase (TIGR00027 family)